MKAWEFGPFLGPILAGLVVAAGAIQLQAIRSASFTGGGVSASTGASAGGATPVVNVPPTTASAPQAGGGITVIVQGHFFGTQQFLDDVVLPAIQDATNHRDFLLFGPNSRQAAVQPGVGVS